MGRKRVFVKYGRWFLLKPVKVKRKRVATVSRWFLREG